MEHDPRHPTDDMASICLNLIVIGLTIGVFVVLFLMSLGTIRAWERL